MPLGPVQPVFPYHGGLGRRGQRGSRILVVAAFVVVCAGCGTSKPAAATAMEPATLERVAGSDLQRVRLTQRASERLGIQTAVVRDATVARKGAPAESGARRIVVPYAAVLYDIRGDTWTYVSPEPLVFVRHPIRVDYIEGDLAVLHEGPPSGTAVVTVGVAELFGIELGVGK